MTLVTAIIPSVGRPELRRAVESVVSQSVPVHPLVVLDRPELEPTVHKALEGLTYELITTRGREMGGATRNIGVQAARTPFVAFLDDDDEWAIGKTHAQLGCIGNRGNLVVTSRVELIGSTSRVVPENLFAGRTTIGTYLLDRSTVRLRRNFMQSSTILMPRDLALRVPWAERLTRHQDWDLLIRLEEAGAEFRTLEEPLAKVYQDSSGSISKSQDWRASIQWLDSVAGKVSERSRGDFLASIAMRSAVRSRQYVAAADLFVKAVISRCHPLALVAGLIGGLKG